MNLGLPDLKKVYYKKKLISDIVSKEKTEEFLNTLEKKHQLKKAETNGLAIRGSSVVSESEISEAGRDCLKRIEILTGAEI